MTTKLTESHFDLRGIYLNVHFSREHKLQPKTQYPIQIAGTEPVETSGTLNKSGTFIGGLAKMYSMYDLAVGDTIDLDFKDGTIIVTPPIAKLRTRDIAIKKPITPEENKTGSEAVTVVALGTTVFARQKLKHIHIPEFAPANLTGWLPQSETDLYLVFGMLAEYTDFRYCCGANQQLIDKLGYAAKTKPDAILIDRSTDEYLMSEFKMYSSDFVKNHAKDDVDVLVCWIDDAEDRSWLPSRVVALKDLREKAVVNGDIELTEVQ